MVNMAMNDYHNMANDIMREQKNKEVNNIPNDKLQQQTSSSLFSQAAEKMKSQNNGVFPSGSDTPATDGEIAGVVLDALSMSNGSPEQIMDALGANDFQLSDEERAHYMKIFSSGNVQQTAAAIDEYMMYASPGVNAIVEVLQGSGQQEPVDEDLMQEQMQP